MSVFEAYVGLGRYGDGEKQPIRLASQGGAYLTDIGARHAEQTMRGRSFVWRTVTEATIPVMGSGAPTLWNPTGSGVVCVVSKVTLQTGAVGTPAVSGINYGYSHDLGDQIGTASPVPTGTRIAGVSTCIGQGGGSPTPKTFFLGFTNTFTAAPVLLCAAGFSLGSTSTETPYTFVDDIDGRICVYPGGGLSIAASTTTSKTFNVNFWGYEVPLPLTA